MMMHTLPHERYNRDGHSPNSSEASKGIHEDSTRTGACMCEDTTLVSVEEVAKERQPRIRSNIQSMVQEGDQAEERFRRAGDEPRRAEELTDGEARTEVR